MPDSLGNKDEIIEYLALKYKKPKSVIEQAVMHQYKFVKNNAERPDMPSIRLPYSGIFKANKKKLQKIKEQINAKKQK